MIMPWEGWGPRPASSTASLTASLEATALEGDRASTHCIH